MAVRARCLTSWLAATCIASVTSAASAHITLNEPAPRHTEDSLKDGPCGVGPGDVRAMDPARITHYAPGETITVRWTEVIDHPSHFRISLVQSDEQLVGPTGFADTSGNEHVLLDGIVDHDAPSGERYEQVVTLPNEPCPACTLQLIQVMQDKPPWGDGNDIYYQCADLVIEAGAGGEGAGTGGSPAISGGASGTGATGSATGGNASRGEEAEGGGCQMSRAAPSRALWALAMLSGALGLVTTRRLTQRRADRS